MKPENRVKLDEFKKKVKICLVVFAVVIVIGMVASIVTLSLLLHNSYKSLETNEDIKHGCLNDDVKISKSDKLKVENSTCEDPVKHCGNHAKCILFKMKDRKETAACSCFQGFDGSPPYCHKHGDQVGCSNNSDCPDNQTCLGDTCQDPCKGLVVCGLDATCEVIKHLAICRCKFHQTGDPFISCDRQDWTTLLVVNGVNDEEHSITRAELIDLSTGKRCNRKLMPDYPIGVSGSVGGLLFNGGSEEQIDPIVCGGSMDNGLTTSACYILKNKNNHYEWDPVANLTEPRSHSSVTSYPVSNSSVPEGLLVAGGRSNRRLFNSDFISYNGLQSNIWQKFVMLPRAVQSHCMLTLNSTTLIMIGGRTHTGPIRETVFYDLVHQKWHSGPELQTSRSGHSCVVTKSESNGFEVLVAGGNDGSKVLNSVEILKSSSAEWVQGPLLPFELEHGVAVGGGANGIFLIGGKSSSGKKNKDSILRLRKGKWETLKISLEVARSLHVAMLVPSALFKCS